MAAVAAHVSGVVVQFAEQRVAARERRRPKIAGEEPVTETAATCMITTAQGSKSTCVVCFSIWSIPMRCTGLLHLATCNRRASQKLGQRRVFVVRRNMPAAGTQPAVIVHGVPVVQPAVLGKIRFLVVVVRLCAFFRRRPGCVVQVAVD
mgnify:CR=1 FL=1